MSERKRKATVGPRQMRRRVKIAVEKILKNVMSTFDEMPNLSNDNDVPFFESSDRPLLDGRCNTPQGNDGHIADADEPILMEAESPEVEPELSESGSILNSSTDEDDLVSPELLPGFDWSIYEEIDNSEGRTSSDSFVAHARKSLAEWVLKSNIPRVHVTSLLKCLHDDINVTYLPLDWRTLLKANSEKIHSTNMPPGDYNHLGVIPALNGVLKRMEAIGHVIPQELKLLFNVDGIPISNSSLSDFWPTLFKVSDWHDVLVAGIYHGKSKPADMNMYLAAFRDDIIQLRNGGLNFRGKIISVSVCGMSSDSPATTFVLNIAAHNGYYGCRKCTTKGLWVSNVITNSTQAKTGGRVTFPELCAPLRCYQSFRNKLQPKHHKENGKKSIMEDILVDVVGDFVLDYMHLVCIGVYKKMLTSWSPGRMDSLRLKKEAILEISKYRLAIRSYIPTDFSRKPRPFEELPRWKATEHRLDLLYICPVAYKNSLSTEKYNHLMVLHVAIKLLVNVDTCKEDAPYAELLLRRFVSPSRSLYGDSFVSFNVHCLIHLANDVIRHGCLDKFSAFPFENKLQIIKNLVRKSGRPLQQIVRRLIEIQDYIV